MSARAVCRPRHAACSCSRPPTTPRRPPWSIGPARSSASSPRRSTRRSAQDCWRSTAAGSTSATRWSARRSTAQPTESERRAAHRALADSLAGNEAHADRRAWHLAAATIGQEDGAVEALEQAAVRAEERGGPLAAARALRRAAELSSDPARRGGQLTTGRVAHKPRRARRPGDRACAAGLAVSWRTHSYAPVSPRSRASPRSAADDRTTRSRRS